MNNAPLQKYFQAIEKLFKAGKATEHSYRPALRDLVEELGTGITATNEPKRIKCGAPDYVIERNGLTIGYIEAKDVGVPLDKIEKDEQLGRYRRALENLILTDYVEFRWYVNGEKRMAARLASTSANRHLPLDKQGTTEVLQLLQSFLEHSAEPIRRPQELAKRMARLAHMIRDVIIQAFKEKEASDNLRDLYAAFQEVLLPELSEAEFADMFAQTMAYGLFAARYNHTSRKPFSRTDAAKEIPRTNPFLRRLFGAIAGPDLDDEPFVGFVDELAQTLSHTEMDAVLAGFGKATRQEDPIVHFYETFLAQYDPKLKELRGVYYTPEPVVSYIVRSVDYLLSEHFDCPDGLADTGVVSYEYTDEHGEKQVGQSPRVLILDPATGTATFLYKIIEHIRENYRTMGNAGMWSAYVREHLLPRLFGFELMMAPYAMAHLKLGMQLAAIDLPRAERADWAYDFRTDERLGVYLTNTLDEAVKRSQVMFGRYISDEANEAAKIKQEKPVMVVLGNPPYNNFGQTNRGQWILDQLKEYKRDLDEKKINLDDDFIKFIRFGQWRIEKSGRGILAFIVSNTFIDGITHRRMRQSLLETFSKIYILNLHGSVRKREKSPDGSKDENVFDITQGVAICVFIKEPGTHRETKVHYADLWGLREKKYEILAVADISTTDWLSLSPKPGQFFFVPKDFSASEEYEKLVSINDIFPQSNTGIQTKRDGLVYHFTKGELERTLKDIISLNSLELTERYDLPPDGRDWTIEAARKDVLSGKGIITEVLYHPFDRRWALYTGKTRGLMAYPRYPLMGNAMKNNLLFLGVRNARRGNVDSFFAANILVDKDAVSPFDNVTFFPLYLYPDPKQKSLFAEEGSTSASDGRRPNLAEAFTGDFATKLKMHFIQDGKGDLQQTFGPENIFDYMYAVFYSPTYRARYAEFLKIDFPRLPLTSNPDLFRALCALGERLVRLHVMEQLGRMAISYPGKGNNVVEKVSYTCSTDEPEKGRVWINKTQYFEPVPQEVWEFHIGGYQVCEKWLKDRKGRALGFSDIQYYQRIVAAIAETITLMEQIDEAIEKLSGWPLV